MAEQDYIILYTWSQWWLCRKDHSGRGRKFRCKVCRPLHGFHRLSHFAEGLEDGQGLRTAAAFLALTWSSLAAMLQCNAARYCDTYSIIESYCYIVRCQEQWMKLGWNWCFLATPSAEKGMEKNRSSLWCTSSPIHFCGNVATSCEPHLLVKINAACPRHVIR